jgi:hypothetical protein
MDLHRAGLLLVALSLCCATSRPPARTGNQGSGRGTLDKKVIKSVILEHNKEVRACYQMALSRQPDLAGRVLSQFTICGTGEVVSAVVRDSTLANPTVEECVRRRVLSWRFPKPTGGNVDVVYAFNFFPSP